MTGIDATPEEIALLHQDLHNAEAENRRLRREIGKLKAEIHRQREDSPKAGDAKELFDYWRRALGKGNVVFGPKRQQLCLDRLKESEMATLKQAIDGCALRPYVGPYGRTAKAQGADRHDDLALIFRDETYVERFAGYVEAERAERAKRSAQNLKRGTDQLIWFKGRNYDNDEIPMQYGGALRTVFEALAARNLDSHGSGDQYMAQCPAHDDRDPSLSIKECSDGAILLNCFAGCKTADICAALGITWADIGGRGGG